MKFVYLDHGVLVEWLKKSASAFNAVEKLVKDGFQPVYSPAHIEELAVPVQRSGLPESIVMDEMRLLSGLTKNYEVLPSKRRGLREVRSEGRFGAFICKENPKQCYKRVTKDYEHLNGIAEGGQKSFSVDANQNAGGRVPGTVNRLDPQSILQQASMKFSILLEYREIFHGGHMYVAMHTGIESQSPFIEVLDPEGCIEMLKGNHDATQAMIESVIKCLIRERYYPDPVKKYRSEMHDITHAIYASYFDLYVIEDARSRERCKAAYEFLGVKTRVLSPAEVVQL